MAPGPAHQRMGKQLYAAGIFERLDVLNRDRLGLSNLPRTPQQIAIEGPCRTPKKRKGRDQDWFG